MLQRLGHLAHFHDKSFGATYFISLVEPRMYLVRSPWHTFYLFYLWNISLCATLLLQAGFIWVSQIWTWCNGQNVFPRHVSRAASHQTVRPVSVACWLLLFVVFFLSNWLALAEPLANVLFCCVEKKKVTVVWKILGSAAVQRKEKQKICRHVWAGLMPHFTTCNTNEMFTWKQRQIKVNVNLFWQLARNNKTKINKIS